MALRHIHREEKLHPSSSVILSERSESKDPYVAYSLSARARFSTEWRSLLNALGQQ